MGLPSLHGKLFLIYNDLPFDSKVDYCTKLTLPSSDINRKAIIIGLFAYADI